MKQHGNSSHARYSDECVQKALFLHAVPLIFLVGPFVLSLTSILLTVFTRMVKPGDGDSKQSDPEATDVESTSLPDISIPPVENDEDQPPPYNSPEFATVAPSPSPPKSGRSSAQSFVLGSALFAANIVTLFMFVLSIQAATYCVHYDRITDVEPRVVLWLLFSAVTAWATCGMMSWVILLRDLWGPGAKKKLPINEAFVVITLIAIVVAPFWAVGSGAVKAVEACQRRFCGDALEDAGVELTQPLGRRDGRDGDEDGSSSREEETFELLSYDAKATA